MLAAAKRAAKRAAEPPTDTPTPDTPPTDTPTPPEPQREASRLQSDASGCKGEKAYASGCKGMQAKKQAGGSKGARASSHEPPNLAKRRQRSKPWRFQRGVSIFRVCMRQGSLPLLARLSALSAFALYPLPPPSCFCGCIAFAFRSHYGFFTPLHSACIRFSSSPPPFAALAVSGCRLAVCRVSGCRLAALLLAWRLAWRLQAYAPTPFPCPLPLPRRGKFLRLHLLRDAAAFQSSDLCSLSARIRLLMYRPLFGNVESQYSFSLSSLKVIIFWLRSPSLAYRLRMRSFFSSSIVCTVIIVFA